MPEMRQLSRTAGCRHVCLPFTSTHSSLDNYNHAQTILGNIIITVGCLQHYPRRDPEKNDELQVCSFTQEINLCTKDKNKQFIAIERHSPVKDSLVRSETPEENILYFILLHSYL